MGVGTVYVCPERSETVSVPGVPLSINVASTVYTIIWAPIMDCNENSSGSEEAFVTTADANGFTGTSGVIATAAALNAKACTGLAMFFTLCSPLSSNG